MNSCSSSAETTHQTPGPVCSQPAPRLGTLGFGARLLETADAMLSLVGHAWGRTEALVADAQRDTRQVVTEASALHRSMQARSRQLGIAVRSTPRFTRIMGCAALVIARYRIAAARLQHLPEEVAASHWNHLHEGQAARVVALCNELGGGLLKLGQLASARTDLLPKPWTDALASLQDDVTAVPEEALDAALGDWLGPLEELFLDFERQPLAAASIAQVHRATLPDGSLVAVKVQRPGIDEVIASDIAALQLIVASLGESVVAGVDLETTVAELARALNEELDFEAEAAALAEFHARWRDETRVRVPAPISELCGPRVLVMEWVDGQRVTDWLDGAAPDAQAQLLGTLVECFAAQILRDGHFHADPHPGNLLVADGRLVLLDFGCVGRLPEGSQSVWGSLMAAVVSRDGERTAALLSGLGFEARDGGSLVPFAELFLDAFMDQLSLDLSSMDPAEQLALAMELLQDNPVARIPAEFVLIGRVLATLGGLLFTYRPPLNLLALVAPHLSGSPA